MVVALKRGGKSRPDDGLAQHRNSIRGGSPPHRGRVRAHACARPFRNACRDRFRSHLLGAQPPRRNGRTCFEGPFGEVIRATGPMAKANPLRFSTKYQDDETDLLYYGYRYYNASAGGWLSRDPLEDQAGGNLYRFVDNRPTSAWDSLGLVTDETLNNKADRCGRLTFWSEGHAKRDPWYWSPWLSWSSGSSRNTTKASYWQWVKWLYNPRGICNSGDTDAYG
jgi:RHS repeat-associated protein